MIDKGVTEALILVVRIVEVSALYRLRLQVAIPLVKERVVGVPKGIATPSLSVQVGEVLLGERPAPERVRT